MSCSLWINCSVPLSWTLFNDARGWSWIVAWAQLWHRLLLAVRPSASSTDTHTIKLHGVSEEQREAKILYWLGLPLWLPGHIWLNEVTLLVHPEGDERCNGLIWWPLLWQYFCTKNMHFKIKALFSNTFFFPQMGASWGETLTHYWAAANHLVLTLEREITYFKRACHWHLQTKCFPAEPP